MNESTEHALLLEIFDALKRALIYQGVYRSELVSELERTGRPIDGRKRQELLDAHSQFVNQLFAGTEKALSDGSPLQPLLADLLEKLRTMEPESRS